MFKQHLDKNFLLKLHNAYLISTDNTRAALSFILSFLSRNFYADEDALKHSDFMLIQKIPGNAKNISIDQIRDLHNFLNKTPIITDKKAAIIFEADRMNLNASNACLKILEDTPKNTYIFLITTNPAFIVSTIRSRCAKITHNFHDINTKLTCAVDDYYIKPFLKATKMDEHLTYLKEFANKDREVWVQFTTSAQNLFTRIIKKLTDHEIVLSNLELEFLEELSLYPVSHIIEKYNRLINVVEDTIKFDLDLKASYLILIKI